jgi:hypothetical protein
MKLLYRDDKEREGEKEREGQSLKRIILHSVKWVMCHRSTRASGCGYSSRPSDVDVSWKCTDVSTHLRGADKGAILNLPIVKQSVCHQTLTQLIGLQKLKKT